MENIIDVLNEGDIFIADIYNQNNERVYLILEKDLDTVFNTTYLILLTDKSQRLLVNSRYLDIKRNIQKIND